MCFGLLVGSPRFAFGHAFRTEGSRLFVPKTKRRALLPRAVLLSFHIYRACSLFEKKLLDIEQKFAILGATKTVEGLLPPTRLYSRRAHSSNGQALVRYYVCKLQMSFM